VFAAPSSSERRKSSMRRRSSLHPVLASADSEVSQKPDLDSIIRSVVEVHSTGLSVNAADDCDANESCDDMEITGVLPAVFANAVPAEAPVASGAAALAAMKSPGKRISSQKIESLVSVFESKAPASAAPKLSALKSPPPFRGLRAEEPPAPCTAAAAAYVAPAAVATAPPASKPAAVVEDKASLVRNLIKRIESNHQAIAGTPGYKCGTSSDVATPITQATAACTPLSAAPFPASAAALPSIPSMDVDNSLGPFACTLTLPVPMATLATPTTSSIAPAVASAVDQSSFVDTSLNTRALDCSLNASMDCSLNGSFSDVRQSKPKPVVVATLADKARRDAEKKAAELESASALRLDSEAKHKAARERRLQLEEENRRRLEEAEKAKREREAAKQAAVKVQLDEEQRRRREEEEKRKREKDAAAAALEEAKRKEQAQARAIQKVPASLVATCSAPSSSSLDTAMQRQAMFSPNKAPASLTEQTSISSLIAPTVVPASIFSPQKPAVSSSLFGGVKSLISTVGGIFSPKTKTGGATVTAVAPTLHVPAPASQKMFAAAAAVESGPTSYDISNDCNSADECSDSESNASAKKPHAVWSKKEILLPMLKRQATTNPDDVFGKCPTSVDLAAVFHKEKPRKRRYSQRTSSGMWEADRLLQEEEEEYLDAMAFFSQKK